MVSEFLDWNWGYFRLVNPDVIFHGWPRRKSSRWIIHDLNFLKFANFTHSIQKIEFHIYFQNYPKIEIFFRKLTLGNPQVQCTLKLISHFFVENWYFWPKKFERQGCLLSFELEEFLTDSSNRINIDWFCINQSHPRDTHSTFWQMTHRLWLTSFDS